MMKPIFFYGLFMDPELLINDGYSPSHIQIVCLNKHRLEIGSRATLIPDKNNETWGTIMTLSNAELNKLYSTSSVKDYHTISVSCASLKGTIIDAETYILPLDYPFDPAKDTNYAKQLLLIYNKIDLPKIYCLKIKSLITEIENKNANTSR
jgi:hypothetical protein